MDKKLFLKILSVTLGLITFFYTSPIAAVDRQDKLAAQSRFSKYFSSPKNAGLLPAEQFPTSMPVFANAMSVLNRVMLDPTKTEQDIVAAIDEQNVALRGIGVLIDNNVYYRNIGARRIPYLVLAFGQQGQMQDLFFLRDYNEWSDEDLAQIGVRTQEDKDYLKIPGVAGSWLTKHQEIVRGLAAGEEAVSPEEEILDLMVADIATNILTIEEKRAILRRGKESDSRVLSGARYKIGERLKEIEVAVSEEVFNLVRVFITASVGGVPRWQVSRDDETDYFARPSAENLRRFRGAMVAMPAQVDITPISGAARFKALLEKLVESALQERAQGKESLLERFTRQLNAERTTSGVSMRVSADTIDSVIESIFRVSGLDRFFGFGTKLDEQIIERITNSLLIDPDVVTDDLDKKKQAMLEKIRTKAGEFGFTDIQMIPTQPDNATRIMEVPFVKKPDVRLGRMAWKLVARERLNVFEHTLARLIALQEALGEQFVNEFIRNILIVEQARTEFASDFLNDPIIAKLGDEQAFRYAALFSYLAMAKADERFAGALNLKENWPAVVGQYFWITHIYGNPDINMAKAVTMSEEEFGELVRGRIKGIVPTDLVLVNRTLKKYFNTELPEGTNLADLISRIVPAVWEIHNRFVDALGEKAGEYIVATERGLAAGEETGGRPIVIQKGPLEEIESVDHIVIDCKQWNLLLTYVRNPQTGQIEEKDRIALSRINPPLGFIGLFQEHKLQLVFTSVMNNNWAETMVRAKRVIEGNLAAVKIPNSIIRGEGVILMVDAADGIIYVMPETGANPDVLSSLGRRVQAALALQNVVAKLEEAKHLKGFIDLDAKIFQIQNPDFQRLLYNRLQEVYNEGLDIVRIVGRIEGQMPGETRSILDKFNERASSAEWKGTTPIRANTVTIVSSDNTQLAQERERTSTVIRLGFDLQLNLPQLSPAILIARAIISIGGEQNVTGGLLEDIKNLYSGMVLPELRDKVMRANSISELLAIILPPITAEDLRIYEYLLIGKKVSEIAA